MDVLLHVENGRPKRPNTDNHGTYVEDGLWPSLSGSPWEDFFTSRMGRNKIGHRDVQWIDYGWECATRVFIDSFMLKPVEILHQIPFQVMFSEVKYKCSTDIGLLIIHVLIPNK